MRRHGYTLIEMLTVVLVLAAISAIMAPNLASFIKSGRRHAYLDSLPNLAVKARQQARSSGQPVSLVTDDDGGFRLEQTPTDGGDPNVVDRLNAVSGLTPSKLITGQDEVSAAEWQAQFYPDGTSDKAGVELSDNGELWHLSIDGHSVATVESGELPAPQDDLWSAGDYVHRS